MGRNFGESKQLDARCSTRLLFADLFPSSPFLLQLLHKITTTHVSHHISSKIPHCSYTFQVSRFDLELISFPSSFRSLRQRRQGDRGSEGVPVSLLQLKTLSELVADLLLFLSRSSGVHYQSRDGSCLPLCARFLVPDSCRFFPPSHTLISSHPFCLTGNFLVALFTAFRSCRVRPFLLLSSHPRRTLRSLCSLPLLLSSVRRRDSWKRRLLLQGRQRSWADEGQVRGWKRVGFGS